MNNMNIVIADDDPGKILTPESPTTLPIASVMPPEYINSIKRNLNIYIKTNINSSTIATQECQ